MLVILDRDGVINVNRPDSVKQIDEFILIDGAAEAIAMLNAKGYKVAIATNQANIGRGHMTEETLKEIHTHMAALLKKSNAHIDKIYFAPDHPDRAGPLRKPAPGMLLQALKDFNASPEETPFVGDSRIDIEAARAAKCIPVLVRTGRGRETATYDEAKGVITFDSILEAARAIVAGDVS